MPLRFGTDGVRGVAGTELTPELALALGRAAARVLCPGGGRLCLGRDTRRSGRMLAGAFAAGVAAEGVDVLDAGVVPTPAVAAWCAGGGDVGAVVSASHNPFADNGVKLFGPGGRKLDDATEARIEAGLADTGPGRSGMALGAVGEGATQVAGWYRDRLCDVADGGLGGIRVVLDGGHGAAAAMAADVFHAGGAEVLGCIGDAPDGANINDGCGATDPAALAAAVVTTGADLGLAFDGDADRVIAVDGRGAVVDGDALLALFALDLRAQGRLAHDAVAVTVMTNLGFHQAMDAAGISVATTPVGDRAVLEALGAGGLSLGGEQSGHIVFPALAPTGDGMLTGLLLCDLLVRSGRPLAELAASAMTRLPQVLRNVAVADRDGLEGAGEVWDAVASAEAALAGRGRVLLRPSGTERLVRVMVEAPSQPEAEAVAADLAAVVTGALGLG